ncbi:MAG: CerR family C-terminal domain-containing protein [Desulfobacterales bacterium]|nr:CerR family C-terminal domain-containing protein [Desulfobacterales bacterium]
MAKRKDGEETQQRLLDVAGQVFTEKGFHGAKVAQICRRARCNVAAINYYFGSKEQLYVAVFRHAIEAGSDTWEAATSTGSPEQRLQEVIKQITGAFLGGKAGRFLRLYLMELAHPTGLLDETMRELLQPRRERTLMLIAELLGPGASRQDVIFCEMSVINQCRGFLMVNPEKIEWLLERPNTPELAAEVADHIFRFSMAGIEAMRRRK